MVLVGKRAPDFTAKAVSKNGSVIENFILSEEMKGKMFVLYFYPLDFTFVCPSEIIAFHNRMEEFKARGCEVIGVSVDSVNSHIAWRNTSVEKGGIGHINYTLISDLSKQISRSYDVLFNEEIALRGTFLIDKNFVVRHQLVNDLPLGRSIDETLRTIDALQHFEKHGEVCPAGWKQGKAAMQPTSEGVASFLAEHASELGWTEFAG
jgi:peroxiredoxin (alkyl hydroperoxide reductase subunit C)